MVTCYTATENYHPIALTGMVQLVGYCPVKQKVAGSISSQGTCLGCRVQSLVRVRTSDNQSMFLSYTNVSLPLFLPPFPSLLKINKICF